MFFFWIQMYGRYTQELGVYAKEEAARLRDGGVRDGAGLRRNTSVRSRTADLLEYQKDPCAKCQCKWWSRVKSQSLIILFFQGEDRVQVVSWRSGYSLA